MGYWWKYIKPYLPYFVIGPICMIVEVVGEVVLPKLLSTVINRGTDGSLTVSLSGDADPFLVLLYRAAHLLFGARMPALGLPPRDRAVCKE